MDQEDKRLDNELLNQTLADQQKTKKFGIFLTIISLLVALTFLYFSYSKFKKSQEAVNNAKYLAEKYKDSTKLEENKVWKLHKELDSVQILFSKKQKIFEALTNQFKDFAWKPEDLISVDSLTINEAIKADIEITNILANDSSYKDYYKIKIKYYEKGKDSGRVIKALSRTPFKQVPLKDRDYYKIATNRITIHKSVDMKFIKLVGLTLLREGIPIKKISYFKIDNSNKKNFIEISSDEDLINDPNLNFDAIMALTAADL